MHPAEDTSQQCFIQAKTKGHAAELLVEKLNFKVRNLHALSNRRECQRNWPVGTLVVCKPIKELF
jgi:hypothetical protein